MTTQSKLDDAALRSLAARLRRDYSLGSPLRPHPYDIADALEELANLRNAMNQAPEEIKVLREQVVELGRPSDLQLCGSCRQTRCMAQKERQYGKTCWMYAPNTNRDVQELRDEIARLKAQIQEARQ